ncbi:hypothetical protein GEMRC1_002192 [Eukaryota sp. GEM-RC1]
MPRRRQFIDKKTSLRYRLVHRSHSDQLADDKDASPFVLFPVNKNAESQSLNSLDSTNGPTIFSKSLAEEVLPQEKLQLKEGCFGDYWEGDVNKMDEDMKAILFEGEDADEMEDDFVLKLAKLGFEETNALDQQIMDEMSDEEFDIDEEFYVDGDHDIVEQQIARMLREDGDSDEEDEEGLSVEEAFKLYGLEFGNDGSKYDVTVGENVPPILQKHSEARELLKEKRRKEMEMLKRNEWVEEQEEDSSESSNELVPMEIDEDAGPRYDVETVCSRYSTVYHHPEVLNPLSEPMRRVGVSRKTGIAVDPEVVQSERKQKKSGNANLGKSLKEVDKETRKAHKKVIKQQKRENRVVKKEVRQLFSEQAHKLKASAVSGKTTVI